MRRTRARGQRSGQERPAGRGPTPSANRAARSVARSAEEAVLQLQRDAGNAATTRAILRVAAAPVRYTPSGPMTADELGFTKVRSRTMPTFTVSKDGVVASTTKGSVDIEATYVAPGLYDRSPGKSGPRKQLITPEMADLVKQGEQEHADDVWFGHELVAGEAARAVNALAAKPAFKEGNAADMRRHWRAALHDEVSPKLRITAEASEPPAGDSVTRPWTDAISALYEATLARDSAPNLWHTMKRRPATPAETATHKVPEGTTLSVVEKGGEIGAHKSEPYIRARWAALPDRA